MRYCKRCVQPDTRPNIHFDEEGICGACLWEDDKKNIDWNARLEELKSIASWAKQTKSGPYDCVVGVSGGKDSTFQAIFTRDNLGLNPLLVSAEPYESTNLGKLNLQNLKRLGFDIITVKTKHDVMKKLMRHDFFNCLNPNRALEYPLHSSAYIIADKFDIPLVIQGENPGQTLGTSQATGTGGDALRIFQHNTIKANPADIYKSASVSPEDLYFFYVDYEKIKEKIKGVWLSNYVKEWSFEHNALFALKNGLQFLPNEANTFVIGNYHRCEGLDHPFIQMNAYLKSVKFGFGRVTDAACYDIRTGQITREEGVFLVQQLDNILHQNELYSFCNLLDISESTFWETVEKFRGRMWEQVQGNWQLKNPIWEQEPVSSSLVLGKLLARFNF